MASDPKPLFGPHQDAKIFTQNWTRKFNAQEATRPTPSGNQSLGSVAGWCSKSVELILAFKKDAKITSLHVPALPLHLFEYCKHLETSVNMAVVYLNTKMGAGLYEKCDREGVNDFLDKVMLYKARGTWQTIEAKHEQATIDYARKCVPGVDHENLLDGMGDLIKQEKLTEKDVEKMLAEVVV